MTVLGDAALLAVGIAALWFGARWLVDGASRLATSVGISPLVVGLTVVAFGTSAPEVTVSVTAALEGQGDVSVANVVGSNVFNLGVILGIVAVIAPFRVTSALLRRDALAMIGTTVIGAVILSNRHASRLEGAVLLALLCCYLGAIGLAIRRADSDDTAADSTAVALTGGTDGETVSLGREGVRLLAGLGLVVAGGRVLVDAATGIALSLGISAWLVGATVVAAGTSLPELVTSVVAARRGDMGIAAGNVVGSNVFNLLGVLGVAAVVRPMTVDPAVGRSLAWLLVVTAIGTALLATGRRVSRREGVALIAIGLGYWLASALGFG
ncbi:Na+/Ca+ antiporter, CaCA family [Haloterrigena turkmenica DSM 5511]|uniref:Na+/Ca+ antiporter, CaCA family n=1 Tax=Haloterrigena turkmenica (strain ATCC 51198 / DSM 5511 / JCM 9101 / NCIMB 13204 / VKM B-1734 / 4k) TaxID=543526 RepID=D2RV93_HALTV|nr:calcium/sodium antiporter [Haloterrigena turkmenica]ADB61294.1 Na+/Ca+ antiporter, CaCA family [Haloterrigena turkmenica DSM 5511]